MKLNTLTSLALAGTCVLASCTSTRDRKKVEEPKGPQLTVIAESQNQWTGVTVAPDGSLFVCYPRWSDSVPVSVERIDPADPLDRTPFPNEEWNTWTDGADPATHFVCVQSVVADAQNRLWVLDPANPNFEGVVPGGAKLVAFDIATGEVVKTFVFEEEYAPKDSYLNDVRIDLQHDTAYITDSHAAALLVVNLQSGRTRRLLHSHPSVHSEQTPITIDGKTWGADGDSLPDVHVDGIALDEERDTLYYHALTGARLYKIRTRWLRDTAMTAGKRGLRVRTVAETGPVDGMLFHPRRGVVLTDLEDHAVTCVDEEGVETVTVQDPRLAWPDTLAAGPDGSIYVTTSQIHLTPNPPAPYRLFKITVPEAGLASQEE